MLILSERTMPDACDVGCGCRLEGDAQDEEKASPLLPFPSTTKHHQPIGRVALWRRHVPSRALIRSSFSQRFSLEVYTLAKRSIPATR